MSLAEKRIAVYKKAAEFEKKRKSAISRICIFLLGPGYPTTELKKRIEIADQLQKENLNVIVMERLHRWKSITIGDKFRDVLEEFCPDLFVVIFTKRGAPHGVTFEIGYLCGYYGSYVVKEKLAFCIEIETDEKKLLTRYIRELFPKIVFHFHAKKYLEEVVKEIIFLAEIRARELGYF